MRLVRWCAAFAATLMVVAGLTAFQLGTSPRPADAAIGSQFDAGDIIDDSVFFDVTTLSPDQIQQFLNSKVPRCAGGYTCLKDYRENTYTRPADNRCATYPGAGGESAAVIIWKVAQVCGINPEVLIVSLQKEQGLVTSTAPTSGRYQIAMGFACPDTAPCDTAYYGFYNQVYSAARQFRRYVGSPNSWNYRPFQNNYIQWHPNAGCGGSTVYISSRATAALYNYTPYRPNAAALANIYGTGDGCSTYGNRNFFAYFTDWFGSTRGSNLVRTVGDPTVYLIGDAGKRPVPTMAILSDFASLGAVRFVSDAFVDGLPTLPALTNFVRNDSTGEIYLVADSTRYRFDSCAMVAEYGVACQQYTSIEPSQLLKLRDGGAVSDWATVPGDPLLYRIDSGTKAAVLNWASLMAATGGSAPAVSAMPTTVAATLRETRMIASSGSIAVASDTGAAWLVDGTSRRSIPDDFAVAVGATAWPIQSSSLATLSVGGPIASPMISCGGTRYAAGGGALHPIASADGYGLGIADLGNATCAGWPRSGDGFGSQLWALGQDGTVWLAAAGTKRPIPSWTTLSRLTNGQVPTFLPVSDATLARWSTGAPQLAVGTLVGDRSDGRIVVVSGSSTSAQVANWDVLLQNGLTDAVDWVDHAALTGYPTAPSTAPSFVCGTTTTVPGDGSLRPASSTTGMSALTLLGAVCEGRTSATAPSPLLVKSSTSSTVYLVSGGSLHPVAFWARAVQLAGGSPQILTWRPGVLAVIPVGPAA